MSILSIERFFYLYLFTLLFLIRLYLIFVFLFRSAALFSVLGFLYFCSQFFKSSHLFSVGFFFFFYPRRISFVGIFDFFYCYDYSFSPFCTSFTLQGLHILSFMFLVPYTLHTYFIIFRLFVFTFGAFSCFDVLNFQIP